MCMTRQKIQYSLDFKCKRALKMKSIQTSRFKIVMEFFKKYSIYTQQLLKTRRLFIYIIQDSKLHNFKLSF